MKLAVLIVYFLIVFLIGYIASKKMKGGADYILGNRSFNPYITALGAGASDMSGWLMLGLPGAVYVSGINQIWMPIGLIIGAFCNWSLVASRLRVYSEVAKNALTLPLYVSNRFADSSGILRLVMAITSIVFFTVYIASGMAGFALLFKVLFNFPYFVGLTFGFVSIVFYTCMGGFVAVNWVDVFQGSLMFFALLIIPIVIWFEMHGGTDIAQRLTMIHLNYQHPLNGVNALAIISLLGWGLGYFGQPHILVRFMAAKNSRHMNIARNVCMTWMILCLVGAMLIGLFGAALYAHAPLAKPETVFLRAAMSLFTPVLTGILFAAVLSALMSSISAQLVVCSSAVIEDIYGKMSNKKLKGKTEVKLNRIAVALFAVVAASLAVDPHSTILSLVAYAWAGLGAAFGPMIFISLFWKDMTRNGALWGIVVGGLVAIIWHSLTPLGGVFKLYELIPAFVLSCLAIYFVSRWDKAKGNCPSKLHQQHQQFLDKLGH